VLRQCEAVNLQAWKMCMELNTSRNTQSVNNVDKRNVRLPHVNPLLGYVKYTSNMAACYHSYVIVDTASHAHRHRILQMEYNIQNNI